MKNHSMRLGRFSLPIDLVRSGHVSVRRVMSQCIIVRAEMMFADNRIEYQAISWRFSKVPEGYVMPAYEWIWDDLAGELSVKRVDA